MQQTFFFFFFLFFFLFLVNDCVEARSDLEGRIEQLGGGIGFGKK